MIVRSLSICRGPRMIVRRPRLVTNPALIKPRYYSTVNASTSTSISQSQTSLLAAITTDLDRIAPRFEIPSAQIEIIQTPTEFYETLKAKISKAQHRIYLSTLYIGKSEHELIATIRDALTSNQNLRISFLADALRGTRETPDPTTASLLAPLISEFGSERVEIRMFHTPNLSGWRKRLIPIRINEGWGLQHMKLYGIDDEIIMSGANLSSDYFTNRQDRYHLFRSKELTDYFAKIHSSVANMSFDIQPSDIPGTGGYIMSWPSSNSTPSPLDPGQNFKSAASKHLSHLLTPDNSPKRQENSSASNSPQAKTIVYPVLSLVPLIPSSTELPALTQILKTISHHPFAPSTWTFTAGYFNMTPSFRRLLLSTRPASGTVLTAHPHANGFYGSKGVSGMLPAAYTHLAKTFLRTVRNQGLEQSIQLREWKRGTVGQEGGWTYHAKGLWVSFPGKESAVPSLTVVGSSNYTKRSYELDLEANVIIVTEDPGLKKRLGEEVMWLSEYAKPVDLTEFEKPDRKVNLKVRLSMWAVRVLGGAL